MTKDETIIRVNWSKESYLLSDFNKKGKIPLMESDDWGFYQIYGMHGVYGTDSLLYIGVSDEGGDPLPPIKEDPLAPIGERIRERVHKHKWDLSYYADNRVYAGRVVSGKLPEQTIRLAEVLMVYYHQPACNGKNVYMLSASEEVKIQNFRIMNFGNHRQLQVELSCQHYREYCSGRNE